MDNGNVTQIVESDKPLIGLMQHFGSGLDALRYYAANMSYRFGKNNVRANCSCCGQGSVSSVQAFCWRALVNPTFAFTQQDALMLFAGQLGLSLQHTVVDFATVHGFCEACATRTKLKRGFSILVKSIAFFLLLVCTLMVFVGAGGAIMMRADPKDLNGFLIALLLGAIGLVASVFGHIWERRLRIPVFLRTIGRKPFYLSNVVNCDSNH